MVGGYLLRLQSFGVSKVMCPVNYGTFDKDDIHER